MLETFQNHPLRKPALLFGAGVVAILAVILWGQARRNQSLDDLEALQRRLQFTQSGPVVPSAAVLDSLEQANAGLNKINRDLDARLFAGLEAGTSVEFSGSSTAAYFELAEFVEDMYQKFDYHGIAVPEKVRFGFSQFEQQGPEPEILSRIMAQKFAAEVVLSPLLEARPVALVALRREFVDANTEDETLLQQAAGNRVTRRIRNADTIEGGQKVAGFESYTFELEFEGHTESLRRYLKGILSASYPVLVNELAVRPLDRFGTEEAKPGSGASTNPFEILASLDETEVEEGPVPIIRNNLSSFRLVLEVYCGKETVPDA